MNISEMRDVTTGRSRSNLSHSTKRNNPCLHSLNEEKVIHFGGNSLHINVPQGLINNNNPPSVGKEPLKQSKNEIENACLPLAQMAQNIVIKTLRYLGFYISWAKVTPPLQFMQVSGSRTGFH